MVNCKFYLTPILALFLLFFTGLCAQDVKVISEIDQNKAYENQHIQGTITVTHNENQKVDTSSFRLENKPLKVDFVREVKISPNNPLIISIYKFEIEPKSKGLQILPEVSVKVGGKLFSSSPSTYEVESESQPSNTSGQTHIPPKTTKGETQAYLKIDAFSDQSKVYPGQKIHFTYRYTYQGDIALTKEVLPLLDAEGMIKIGEKEFKNYTKDGFNINDISQVVEAVKPGSYTYGPSYVEGYSYQEDSLGNRIYSNNPLKSEAPKVVITVEPFPTEDKPASFNGAIGKFTFDVSLQSPSTVNVGDEMTLSIDISGEGNLDSLSLPDMCCQPGFSGLFKMNDLPPVGVVQGNVKRFIVQLRPLSDTITNISAIEFSYFDPNTKKYTVLHSKPIPITVHPSNKNPTEEIPKPEEKVTTEEKPKPPPAPKAIEIETIYELSTGDLHNLPFGTWWSLAIIPIGIAMLIYQVSLLEYIKKRKSIVRVKTSQEEFHEVFQIPFGTSQFYDLLAKALKKALVEKGEIATWDIPNDALPSTGFSKEVKSFLQEIEERRFAGKEELSFIQIKRQAETLFNRIKNI